MGFFDPGKDFGQAILRRRCGRTSAAGLLAALLLGGCTLSGGGLEDMVDRSITTGSIAPGTGAAAPSVDTDRLSDGRTVRNAVSAAKLSQSPLTVAWANAETGASGTITAIEEMREGSAICRRFTTSRQRFDGIALYDGETCSAGSGEWVLTRFGEAG